MNNVRYLRSERAVLPDGVRPARVEIAGATIVDVRRDREGAPFASGEHAIDLGPLVLMPGLVDSHVHLNEPGRTDWEGFHTGTRAAAAGGITTVIDMPLNSIPATTTVAALKEKLAAARRQCWVDVGFWGGVVPDNVGDLAGLHEAGVLGYKCFLVSSGVGEFAHVDERTLRAALPEIRRLGSVLLVHAEDAGTIAACASVAPDADRRVYSTWLNTRPASAESLAVDLMVRLSHEFNARVHVVHVSAGESLDILSAARRRGIPITAETCPHYLFYCAEEIPDGHPAFKCAPPIRARSHQERLWRALGEDEGEGELSMIVSDHSPAPPALKAVQEGDLLAAWGGISSLQLSLPSVRTKSRARGTSLMDLTRWMSSAPAHLAGLQHRKGAIAAGHDADFVIWDPDASWTVDARTLQHRHPLTPYDGRELFGRVHMTIVGGRIVYEDGRFADEPTGSLLLRGR